MPEYVGMVRSLMQQHLVPHFYLKQFTDPDTPTGHEPYVWLYRFDKKRWSRRAPRNVGVRPDYYGIPDKDGTMNHSLEASLSVIEGKTASLLSDKILPRRNLDDDDRAILALFAALMMSRLPVCHERINDFLSSVAAKVLAMISWRFKDDPEGWSGYKAKYRVESGHDLGEMEPDDIDPSHYNITASHSYVLDMAFSHVQGTAEIIDRMEWVFLESEPEDHFVISDQPLCMVDPTNRHPYFGHGFASRKIEVTLPLTRNIALLCHWGERGTRRVKAADDVVQSLNRRSVGAAKEYIAAPSRQFPGSDGMMERINQRCR
jgi:hypothetical protein